MSRTVIFVMLSELLLVASLAYMYLVGSTRGWVAIKWLLLGWMTVCGQVNHLGIMGYITNNKVSSAFHPSRVDRLAGWGCIHLRRVAV